MKDGKDKATDSVYRADKPLPSGDPSPSNIAELPDKAASAPYYSLSVPLFRESHIRQPFPISFR